MSKRSLSKKIEKKEVISKTEKIISNIEYKQKFDQIILVNNRKTKILSSNEACYYSSSSLHFIIFTTANTIHQIYI